MMDATFLQKLTEMADFDKAITQVAGRDYSFRQLTPVQEPTPSTIGVQTLTAIVDYLKENPDGLKMEEILVHVTGPMNVVVASMLSEPWQQRKYYLQATSKHQQFSFNQWQHLENFIVAIQSYFVQSDETTKILRIIGNLTDSKVTQFNDDGVTQQVTAKTGIARVENVPVPNPVNLAPYRTFLEVEQPISSFIFRIQKAEGQAPLCAFFQADGGSWELEAIQKIKAWLGDRLPKEIIILA